MTPRNEAGQTVCIVLGGGQGTRLYPLTRLRAKPAVPFAGKYRLIDVPISNCLNSGLNRIYVLTQFQSASLHTHVQAAYRFDRFDGGFVEVLAAQQTAESSDWYQGTADAVRQNLIHFGGKYREALILSGDQLYQMNFRRLLDFHRETNADMSIAVLPVSAAMTQGLGIVQVDPACKVVNFREKPSPEKLAGLDTDPALFNRFGVQAVDRPYLASMGIYVFNRKVLTDELTQHRYVDFGKNLFPACIDRYRVMAFVFDGYWEDIGTVKSFHEANLQLAKHPAPFRFASDEGLIFTRPRTLPPSLVQRLTMRDSMIADGCTILGAELDNSILGIRAQIGDQVRLVRTIVMGADYLESAEEKQENRRLGRPNVGIGNRVIIEDAIVDKNARIGDDVVIRRPETVAIVDSPIHAVRDGVICIFKDAVVPSGTRIGT